MARGKPEVRPDERGSILAVTSALMVVVVAVAMVVLEISWVQYIRINAQRAADFAAEAGARMRHERIYFSVWRNMEIKKTRKVPGPGGKLVDEEYYEWAVPAIRTGAKFDVHTSMAQVYAALGCNGGDSKIAYVCISGPVESPDPKTGLSRWVVFYPTAGDEAVTTFLENWQDRSAAYLKAPPVGSAYSSGRKVVVQATIIYRPLFLGVLEPKPVNVTGVAQVQLAGLK